MTVTTGTSRQRWRSLMRAKASSAKNVNAEVPLRRMIPRSADRRPWNGSRCIAAHDISKERTSAVAFRCRSIDVVRPRLATSNARCEAWTTVGRRLARRRKEGGPADDGAARSP